jgi:cytochrome P450
VTATRLQRGHDGLPPVPPGGGVVHALRWMLRPLAFLEHCCERYGDVFAMDAPGIGRLVFVADPGLVKEVLQGDPRQYHAGESNRVLDWVLGPGSVFILDEDLHLDRRRRLLGPLHGDRIHRQAELTRDLADAQIDLWPVGLPFPLRTAMATITLRAILWAVFGASEPSRRRALEDAVARLLAVDAVALSFLPVLRRDLGRVSPYGRYLAVARELDGHIHAEMADRRRARDLSKRDDVLSILLAAQDEQDGQDGSRPMTDADVRDQLVTLLLAGHETTATGLAWAFELLLRHPSVLARLQAEVDEEGAQGRYLQAVVQETLRLRPIIPNVARRLTRATRLGPYELPEGTIVAPCIHLLHHRADLYPRPTAFLPERFLAEAPGTYTWLPFGGGVRRCLGASFATQQMRVVLARVLGRTRLRAASPRPEAPRRRGVTLAPEHGALAVVEARLPRPQSRTALVSPA